MLWITSSLKALFVRIVSDGTIRTSRVPNNFVTVYYVSTQDRLSSTETISTSTAVAAAAAATAAAVTDTFSSSTFSSTQLSLSLSLAIQVLLQY